MKWNWLIIDEDGTVTGTNDESVARDLNQNCVVIALGDDDEGPKLLDADFDPQEIPEA